MEKDETGCCLSMFNFVTLPIPAQSFPFHRRRRRRHPQMEGFKETRRNKCLFPFPSTLLVGLFVNGWWWWWWVVVHKVSIQLELETLDSFPGRCWAVVFGATRDHWRGRGRTRYQIDESSVGVSCPCCILLSFPIRIMDWSVLQQQLVYLSIMKC